MNKGKPMTKPTKKNEIAVAEPVDLTPMEMLNRAVASGASTEVMTQLMGLQERYEKNQARRAFDAAMADAKAKIPVILKNKHVGFKAKTDGKKDTSYKHETLAEIARTIDPILSEFGLSYRFRTSSAPNEPVTVTCIIAHRNGYSEENTLQAGRDESGNKNSIQAVGSTVTYLQRYTLKAALGLAAAAVDDDGKQADADLMVNEEQIAALDALIVEVGADKDKFLAAIKVTSLADIYATKFDAAVALLEKKRKAKA